MMPECYLCKGEGLQICIVCERDICMEAIAPEIRPGEKVICIGCIKITPNRQQAEDHYRLKLAIKLRKLYPSAMKEEGRDYIKMYTEHRLRRDFPDLNIHIKDFSNTPGQWTYNFDRLLPVKEREAIGEKVSEYVREMERE